MITEKQITRHLGALNDLHSQLDTKKYIPIHMTNLRKKHGVQSHTFKAMCQLDYIQRIGANKGATWRWGQRAKPQPHDARRVIELGLEIKNKRKIEEHYDKRNAEVKIVPVKKKPPVQYVAAKVKPSKPLIVEEETKSILWGLFKYTKIKRKG